MSEIPYGWSTASIGDIATVVRGITFPAGAKESQPGKEVVACLRTASIQREVDWSDLYYVPRQFVKRDEQLVLVGDILMSMANSYELVGKVAAVRSVPTASAFGAFLAAIRPSQRVIGSYLFHLLRSPQIQDEIRRGSSQSVNIANVSASTLSSVRAPIAPIPEQQRIADKLDAILARVDACRDRLDRVGPLLQRFRQSVLARAVSGGVGDQQYDISEWTPCAIGQLGVVVTGNTPARVRASDPTGRIPLFKPTDLSQGDAVCQSDERLTDEGVSGARLLPTGAVLVTCIGATIGKTGLAAVPCATNQQINAVVCDESRVDPRYLYLWFSSPIGQQAVIGNASATTLPIINKSKFASLQVLLPPLAVQRDIAGRVSMLLEQAGRLQRRLDGAAATIHRLAPATLAKAFRGELVPQDPNDEPAAEMLARLSSSTPPKQTARRGRSTA